MSKAKTSTRWDVTARVLAEIFGGYAAAYAATAFLSVYLPLVRSDRVAFAMLVALALSIAELGGEIGGVIWLCQLMLAGLLLVAVPAWKSRWVLPLVSLLPLGGGALALLGAV